MQANELDYMIPATGERAAVSGYMGQYNEFARKLYEHIQDGTLEEVRVADAPKKVGKLDDICYVTTTEVHAYQIKWTINNDTFGYTDFAELLPEIVEGWERLCALYPQKLIIPHLLTNRRGTIEGTYITDNQGQPLGQFPAFREGVVETLRRGETVDAKWADVLQMLKTKIETEIGHAITDEELSNFWRVFVFTTDYQSKELTLPDPLLYQDKDDILALINWIQLKVSSPERRALYTCAEIINELGWEKRTKTKFNHKLFIDTATYEPNAYALELLDAKLAEKGAKGYIFLEGIPGSGKSTILTAWSQSKYNAYIRYYAFDFTKPSSQLDNNSERGECVTFLHDVVRQIEEKLNGSKSFIRPFRDYSLLKNRFMELLGEIGKHYEETKQPTLLIVDGLDHIHREYTSCEHPLLEALPTTAELPDGVVVVLGSQYYRELGLNHFILREYEEGSSTIKMPPLSRGEVQSLATKILGAEKVTPSLIDTLATKSLGHPLYLRYTLNQLSAKPTMKLSSIQTYDENPDIYYQRILGDILQDEEKCKFLGVLARVVTDIEERFIREWNTPERVKRSIFRELGYLFMYDALSHTWSFFHNSFRQYLLRETSKDWLTGEYSENIDKGYYEQLAQFTRETVTENKWDIGFYLYKAEQYEEFMQLLTPERIIEQIHHFRPLWHVQRDIKAAAQIALKRDDPYMMIRVMLLQSEISQMGNQEYNSLDLVESFLQAGMVDLARRQIRDGNEIHCSQNYAMFAARLFDQCGYKEDAKQLFEFSYPDFISLPLKESRKFSHDVKDQVEYLTEWVRTAVHFMTMEEVDAHIERFMNHLRDVATHNNEEYNGQGILFSMKYEVAKSLIDLHRWKDLEDYLKTFPQEDVELASILVRRDKVHRLIEQGAPQDELHAEYQKLNILIKGALKVQIDDSVNLMMASFAQRIGEDAEVVIGYLAKVQWSGLRGDTKHVMPRDRFEQLRLRIRYVELRAASGEEDNLVQLVPDGGKLSEQLKTSFLRKVYKLAQLRGKANLPNQTDIEFMQLVRPYLLSFDHLERDQELEVYSINEQRGDFYAYLVKVAAAYGHKTVKKVGDIVRDIYQSGSWNAEEKATRKLVIALWEAGIDKKWVISMLGNIKETMLDGEDITSKQTEAFAQGKAWLTIGDKDRAITMFRKMIESSSGIGYRKDYQPVTMAEWIGRVNKVDPTRAIERIHWLTSRLRAVYDSCEPHTIVYAGERLMEDACDWNLGTGVKLGKWLLDSEIGYFEAVSSIIIKKSLAKVATERDYRAVFHYYTQIHLYIQDDRLDVDTSLCKEIYTVGTNLLGDHFDSYKQELCTCISTQCFENVSAALLEKIAELENPMNVSKPVKEKDVDVPDDWYHESDRLEAKAKILLDAGDRTGAWETALDALSKSSVYGWAKYNDGGTRINACGLLKQIDSEKGRNIAMHQIAEDISAGIGYGAMQYLDEIARLLTAEVDELKLFDEEMRYMSWTLRPYTVERTDMPNLLPNADGVEETIARWLIFIMKMPIVCLSERAKMLLAHMQGDGFELLADIMQSEQCEEQNMLEVAMYLRELGASLERYRQLAQENAASDNYRLRIFARNILNELGVPLPNISRKSIPTIYSMAIPMPQRDNPLHVMSMAGHIIQKVCETTGIPPINFATRAHQLLLRKGSIAGWDIQGMEIMNHYANISLRYPCRYRKAQPILDATMEASAELVDAGVINEGVLSDETFVLNDFSIISVVVHPKPSFVHKISEQETYCLPSTWWTTAENSKRLHEQMVHWEEMSVIAERTVLCKPQDETAFEEYSMKLSYLDERFMFEGFFESDCIIIRNGYFSAERVKSCRVEFNPEVATYFGWKPVPDGLGKWEDTMGNIMVESIYWQQGNTQYRMRSDRETGEGWYVIASEKAMNQLSQLGELNIHKQIERRKNSEYERPTDSAYVIQKCAK